MDLASYFNAGYSVIYLLTAEEGRAEKEVIKACAESGRPNIHVWSCSRGMYQPSADKKKVQYDESMAEPIKALMHIQKLPGPAVYIFRDIHIAWKQVRAVRMMRDIANDFKQLQKTIVIISPVKQIPPELERDVALIEFDLPDRETLAKTLDAVIETNKAGLKKRGINVDEDERDKIIQAAMGLTTTEAENAYSKAIIIAASMGEGTSLSQLVLAEKASAVKKSGTLEYFPTSETINDIGGLENLKLWLQMRSKAFSKKAREFGLPNPRGALLVGLPGCGKSLAAKATSNILGVPLIRLDIGRVFGGLVGESESNLRRAIQTVEAVGQCVLWIDEMDKAFAGMGGSGSTDGGTSQRVFGNFITWMQEKTAPVFLVATVNRMKGLPPELLRKGRFDEIFFVGLPSPEERAEILAIHAGKYGRDPKNFDFKKCVKESDGFSGAELEEAIRSGLFLAFHNDRELESDDVLAAIQGTNPLSKSRSSDLEEMKNWAEDNAINASETHKGARDQAGRQLNIG